MWYSRPYVLQKKKTCFYYGHNFNELAASNEIVGSDIAIGRG